MMRFLTMKASKTVFVRRGLQFVEALQDGLSGVSGRADFCDDLSAAVLERLALT
jgi:hypothetical protein